jgi:hypothetical protein
MEFKIGDKVKLIDKSGKVRGCGQVESILYTVAQIKLDPSSKENLKKYCYGSYIDWLLSHLKLVEKNFEEETQEEDHKGQIYNPYNNSWSFL